MATLEEALELVTQLSKHRNDQGFYRGRAFELKSAREGLAPDVTHQAQEKAAEASRTAAKAAEEGLRAALADLEQAFQDKMEAELL